MRSVEGTIVRLVFTSLYAKRMVKNDQIIHYNLAFVTYVKYVMFVI